MIVVTTPSMEGRRITQYLGLVSGDAILGGRDRTWAGRGTRERTA